MVINVKALDPVTGSSAKFIFKKLIEVNMFRQNRKRTLSCASQRLCGPIACAGAECGITQYGFNCNTMGGANSNGHSEEDNWNFDGTVDESVVNESNLSGIVGRFRVWIEMMMETEDNFVTAMGCFKKNLPAAWSFDADQALADALAAVSAAVQ